MKKQHLRPVTRGISLCFMLILCYTQMVAQTFTSGSFNFTVTDATQHEVGLTKSSLKTGDIVIPETVDYNGTPYTVTSIGELAFGSSTNIGKNGITNITFPNTIRTIGYSAFSYSTKLKTLNLPTSLTNIGESAFAHCEALETVNIPASLRFVDGYAFSYCDNISKVSITDFRSWCLISFKDNNSNPATKSKARYLYMNGEKLINPEIPSDITEIKDYTFYNNLGIEGDLVIPDNIERVGGAAYYSCPNIESIYLPASLKEVGDAAFFQYGTYKLNKVIVSSIRDLLKKTFVGFGNPLISARHLYDASNGGNQEVTEITIPDDITEIGAGSLAGGPWTEITIPSNIKKIGGYAFWGCENLKSFVIPEGIERIESETFGRTNIENFTLPSTLKFIGNGAFSQNRKLKNIDLPTGLETIDGYAFSDCPLLEKIIIPTTVKTIAYGAFNYCNGLKTVVIPESVETLENAAFSNDPNLEMVYLNMYNPTTAYCPFPTNSSARFIVPAESLKSYTEAEKWAGLKDNMLARLKYEYNDDDMTAKVVYDKACSEIPKGYVPEIVYNGLKPYTVTAFADNAFKNCSVMEGIEYPNTVTSMGNYVFSGCKKLTDVTLPETITRINEGTFNGCESLSDYVIPQNITAIDRMAFNGCKLLKTARIPDTQTEVGDSTFFGCSTLTQITIPSAVKSIGTDAFGECNGLSRVDINSIYDWLDIDFHSAYANPLGYAHHLYVDGNEYTELSLSYDDDVSAIKDYTFFNASNLERVIIPYVTESIGNGAFQNCIKLTTFDLPPIVTIGDFAFSGCANVSNKISIPKSLKSIGYSAFEGCKKIPEVVIKDIAKWMDVDLKNATSNPLTYAHKLIMQNKEITDITVPSNISEIKPFIFSGCRNIKTVNITNSSTKIGKGAFNDCRSLVADFNNLIRNNSEIEDSTFYNCNNITGTIKLPEHTNRIGDYILYGCEKLTGQLTLPNNITSIGEGAFGGCKNISGNAVVPPSVKRIGKKAFCDCPNIERTNFPEGLEYVGDSAFYNCSGLLAVFISKETPIECGTDVFGGTITPASRYLVPFVALDSYKAAPGWSDVKDNISPMLAYTYNEKDHTAEIDAGNYESYPEFCIPSVLIYNGGLYNVTSIKKNAFSTNSYKRTTPLYIDDLNAWMNIDIPNESSYPSSRGGLYLKGTLVTDIVIPDTVTCIKRFAFMGSKVNSIQIPPSVKRIGRNAFYECQSFDDTYKKTTPVIKITDLKAWIDIDYYELDQYSYTPLSKNNYLYLNGEEIQNLIIPDGVEEIKAGAFNGIIISGYIYIPASVKKIGEFAFGIKSQINGLKVEDINAYMNIDIKSGVLYPQGKRILYDKDGNQITEIVVPESITRISDFAFRYVKCLTKVTFHDNITSIGKEAFSLCYALKQINLPKNLTEIKASTFYNCGLSSDLFIPKSVKKIEREAFSYNDNLTSITFENGSKIDSIMQNAFYHCWNIRNINIPNSVTYIDTYALRNTGNLETVVIPQSVKTLGEMVFSYSENLKQIVSLNPEPCQINYAFYKCNETAVLYVPVGSVDKYKSANGWKDIADIREMPEKTITITSAGYSTFYSPFQYILPSGLTAYVLRKIEDNVATLSPLGANSKGEVVIPSQTAVVLKGAQGDYTFKPTTEYGTNVNNLLEGFFTTADVLSDGVMTLGVVDGNVGFYNYTGSVLNEYKAFLPKRNLPDEVASGAKKLDVEFDFEVENTPTNITEIREETQEKDVIYTIEGVKVDKIDHKGIYIRNGKKIFVK